MSRYDRNQQSIWMYIFGVIIAVVYLAVSFLAKAWAWSWIILVAGGLIERFFFWNKGGGNSK